MSLSWIILSSVSPVSGVTTTSLPQVNAVFDTATTADQSGMVQLCCDFVVWRVLCGVLG